MRIAVGSDHRGMEMRGKLVELLTALARTWTMLAAMAPNRLTIRTLPQQVGRKVSTGRGRSGNPHLRLRPGAVHCREQDYGGSSCAALRRRDRRIESPPQRSERALPLRDMLGHRLVDRLVEIWLDTPFDGGRHARRLAKISKMESSNGQHGS